MFLENRRRVPRATPPMYWVVELRRGWWIFATPKKIGFSCRADARALAEQARQEGKLIAGPRHIQSGESHTVPERYGSGCSYVEVE